MTRTAAVDYPFTEEEARAAYDEWNCNCGPTALAFALQCPLENVRHAIPGFAEKHYTSPTMMRQALQNLSVPFESMPAGQGLVFWDDFSLVRIQWTGPWTAPGANPKWAYRQTHWICTWRDANGPGLFDVNGGIMGLERWKTEIVPLLTATYLRADGGWFPTHIWRLKGR